MKCSKALLAIFLLAAPAHADMMDTGVGGPIVAGGGGFTGPGDIVSGALGFWSLRAYNSTYASGHGKLANICTPADAVCADVNSDSSGNFNLAGTPSLTCNNGGSICTVKILYDQSGALQCGGSACDLSQATIANRPTLITTGSASCTTTSNFCAQWGATTVMNSPGTFPATSQPFTIAHVYNNPARANDAGLFSTSFNNATVLSGFGGANKISNYVGSSVPTATASDGAYHSTQSVFNDTGAGTASTIVVDSTATAGSLGATTGFNANSTLIVGQFSGSDQFQGFINQIGLWGAAFTGTQSTNLCHNDRLYWNSSGFGSC